MKAIIITIGDELLIGQVVNTNASFIAGGLNSTGIEVANSRLPTAMKTLCAFGEDRRP
jgi:nicotinamide-nucleotide amidase